MSEVTSDLVTDVDDEAKQIYKKGKVITPRRYISSDENEELDNNCPPHISRKLKSILKESQLQSAGAN